MLTCRAVPCRAVQGLEHHQGLKSQGELKRFGHRFFATEFGDKAKVAEANNGAQVRTEGNLLLRVSRSTSHIQLTTHKPVHTGPKQLQRVVGTPVGPGPHWRQNRAYVMADHVAWTQTEEEREEGDGRAGTTGTLTVRTRFRGGRSRDAFCNPYVCT